MCRLFGCYITKPERLTVPEMIALVGARQVDEGPDAYGWASWSGGNSKIRVVKREGLIDSASGIDTVLRSVPRGARWVIGHTRFATHGSPAVMANNHPITHKRIVGAHNGVVWNYRDVLDLTGRQDNRAEVDSEAIFAAIHRWGVDGLAEIEGDVACVWADRTSPATVHIARGYGRDISVALTTKGNYLWASDGWALDALYPLVRFQWRTKLETDQLVTIRNGSCHFTDRIGFPTRPVTPFTSSAAGKASKKGELMFPTKGKGRK